VRIFEREVLNHTKSEQGERHTVDAAADSMVTGGGAARLLCVCEVALSRDSLDSRYVATRLRKNDREIVCSAKNDRVMGRSAGDDRGMERLTSSD
jgi:hypothetical protein